jgi:SagB-type dehydrogenase family enzyme
MPYQRTREQVEEALVEHDYLRGVGTFAMQHSIVSIYSSSTVVRTPETVLRGRWAAADDGLAGEQLLLNYRTDNSRMGFQLGLGRFYEPDAAMAACHADLEEDLRDAVALPPPRRLRTALTAAITSRRSTRAMSGEPVDLADVATILHHAQGVSGELPYGDPANPHGVIKLRNAPSGGGLYPVTVFVHALRVAGAPAGTYEYLPYSHAWKPVPHQPGTPELTDLLHSTDLDINRAALVLTFVYNLYHNSRKYGDEAVVFGLIEVGAILQNVHLARTALALAGTDQGGYDKPRIERALGLDGHTRHVVHVTIIGQEG